MTVPGRAGRDGDDRILSRQRVVRGPVPRTWWWDTEVISEITRSWNGFDLLSRTTAQRPGSRGFDAWAPGHRLTLVSAGNPIQVKAWIGEGPVGQFEAEPGQVILWPDGGRIRGETRGTGVLQQTDVYFRHDALADLSGGEFEPTRIRLRFTSNLQNPIVSHALRALADEAARPGPLGRIYGESLGIAILVALVRDHADRGAPRRADRASSRRLARVIDYIEAHLAEDLPLARLSAEACLSPMHFVRQFKRLTGRSPHQYILVRRVERAKELLADRDIPIKDVAARTGFSSQSHFTDAFRRVCGAPPAAWRRRVAAPASDDEQAG